MNLIAGCCLTTAGSIFLKWCDCGHVIKWLRIKLLFLWVALMNIKTPRNKLLIFVY